MAGAARTQIRVLAGPQARLRKKIHASDLINGGVLRIGMMLLPARKKYSGRFATPLPDGRIEIDGIAYDRPTEAASAVTRKRTGGWWFFLTDQASRTSLRQIRRDCVNAMAVDDQDDEADDDDEQES